MLSQSVDYALRAVVHLAFHDPEPRTTEAIAEATLVPRAYLSKVLQSLVRAGLLHSQRGIHGGMNLSRPPEEITVLDVVNAVEPIQRIRQCPLGLSAHGVRLCPLHKRLDNALETVESAFGNTTVAEILAERSNSVPLCEIRPIRGNRPTAQRRR